jgi:hypothetical protein
MLFQFQAGLRIGEVRAVQYDDMLIIEVAKRRQKEQAIHNPTYIFSLSDTAIPQRSITDLYTKYCNKWELSTKAHIKQGKRSYLLRLTIISILIRLGIWQVMSTKELL